MAKVTSITLNLSMNEAMAVRKALGSMTRKTYGESVFGEVLFCAGGEVFSELNVIVEDE